MNHTRIPTGYALRLLRLRQRVRDWLLRNDPAIDDGLVLFLLAGYSLFMLYPML